MMRRLLTLVAVATLYFFTGKLSQLLAIPPGYSTPVWPAAGIALGACLYYGQKIWPGILLGSFLINFTTALTNTPNPDLTTTYLLPLFMGGGAVLQAIIGYKLIHYFSTFPVSLNQFKKIINISFLGGPVACLSSATIGTTMMYFFGNISQTALFLNWIMWWLGDTIGVLIFLPLLSIYLTEMTEMEKRGRLIVTLPLILSVCLTIAVFYDVRAHNSYEVKTDFIEKSKSMHRALEFNFDRYVDILYSIRSLFDSSQEVERIEFRQFTSTLLDRYNGIQALEWVPHVSENERGRYEKDARIDGFTDFSFKELGKDNSLILSQDKKEYYPVYFVEPYEGNATALGFDLASSPQRKKALQKARNENLPVTTQSIELVQEKEKLPGILIFLPIYSSSMAHSDKQDARTFMGFALGVYRIPDIVLTTLQNFFKNEVTYCIEEPRNDAPSRVLFSSLSNNPPYSPTCTPQNLKTNLSWSSDIHFGSKKWIIYFYPTPKYLESVPQWNAWMVLTGGLFFSSLLGAFLFMLVGRSTELKRSITLFKTEIRQRKIAEKSLKTSESRFRTLIESAPDAILIVDQTGNIVYSNNQVEKVFGYSPVELKDSWHDILVPEFFRHSHQKHRIEYFAHPRTRPMGEGQELLGLRKDGTTFPIEITLSPQDTDQGVQTICIARDITKRKKDEEELRNKATQLHSLYEMAKNVSKSLSIKEVVDTAIQELDDSVSPDISVIFLKEEDKLIPQGQEFIADDLQQHYSHAHTIGECLCGISAQKGEPAYSIDIHNDARCTWPECKRSGVVSFASLPLFGKDGLIGVLGIGSFKTRDFKKQADYLETLAGQIAFAMDNAFLYQRIVRQASSLEKDIEKRTAELRLAKERAESADRLKSSFLASMSHELRTPLNSIIGFTGIILQGIVGPLNAEQNKQLSMVQGSANHLLNLINDILDLSKIEAGELKINVTTFNFAEAIKEILQSLTPLAEKRGNSLTFSIADTIGDITTDRQRLEQIVINLVNNSIKFTENGSIHLKSEPRKNHLVTTVSDSGIGIDSEDIQEIFQTFRQAEKGLARKYEGTGLGLSICQNLIKILGGDIQAQSDGLQRGSTFTLSLPYPLTKGKE